MQTLGQRLFNLRRSKKLSRDALGAKIGVSKTAIKNWEEDSNFPKHEFIDGLSKVFGCSIGYLVDGIPDGDNFKVVPMDKVRRVPVLNYVQAGEFCEYYDDAVSDVFEPVIGEYGAHVYWVIIEGLSMMPDFNSGDMVLVDPDIQPTPGDYVIALRNGHKEVTFKKWRPRGFDDDGVEYSELVPLNPDFPVIDSRHAPFAVCGVAIEHKKKLK